MSSVMSELKSSTRAVDHDFLHLPQLLKTFCSHDYHVSQIKSVLNQISLLCGTFEMHHLASDRLDPKTLILIWNTGASAGLTPFCSDSLTKLNMRLMFGKSQRSTRLLVLALRCISLRTQKAMLFICLVFLTTFH